MTNGSPALRLEGLKKHFEVDRRSPTGRVRGIAKAVDGVDLEVAEGEILGLVGESGCGKSTLGRTILHLLKPTAGKVVIGGTDLSTLSPAALRRARPDFQMIFQDPYASLNPRRTVHDTLAEAFRTRRPDLHGAGMADAIAELLKTVGLSPAASRRYPHEFSGGQRQRVAIARALAPEPRVIVADEPVSALDVSVQSQILNLLRDLCRERDLTMIFISHDLSVVRFIADRIAVMYLGKIVELGAAEAVVDAPRHVYTKALMSAIPRPDPRHERSRQRIVLAGDPSSPLSPPAGCIFWPRSPVAHDERWKTEEPPFAEIAPGHFVSRCPHCTDGND